MDEPRATRPVERKNILDHCQLSLTRFPAADSQHFRGNFAAWSCRAKEGFLRSIDRSKILARLFFAAHCAIGLAGGARVSCPLAREIGNARNKLAALTRPLTERGARRNVYAPFVFFRRPSFFAVSGPRRLHSFLLLLALQRFSARPSLAVIRISQQLRSQELCYRRTKGGRSSATLHERATDFSWRHARELESILYRRFFAQMFARRRAKPSSKFTRLFARSLRSTFLRACLSTLQ